MYIHARSVGAIASLLFVVGCAGSTPPESESAALTSGPDLSIVSQTVPPRAKPGGPLAVSIKVKNIGTTTWGSSVKLIYVGDAGWTNTTLTAPGTTKPNATATFSGTLGGPTQIGRYTLAWRAQDGGTSFGPLISAGSEVTCSDGVFCNGDERYVNGKCVAGVKPCDDGAACSGDACDEDNDRCLRTVSGSCETCAVKNCNPNCHGAVCGDDGCGGSCGPCLSGQVCAAGVCINALAAGTCANPLELAGAAAIVLPGLYITIGDNTDGYDEVIPSCDAVAAPEKIYRFTVDQVMGIDAQSFGIDTVLSIYSGSCGGPLVGCNDDAAPPGNYGSHVYKLLQPGPYTLVVNGFDTHAVGQFTLQTRFVAGCVPQCDGKFCGDDGCSGSCGECGVGQICSDSRCVASPCAPQCMGRQCGTDGCGGSCGDCQDGKACDEVTGACKNVTECDHDRPVCTVACSSQEYCGSDCACHRNRDARPDLVVDIDALKADWFIDTLNISESSCTLVEHCVGGPGLRRLLHFTVGAINQGAVDLVVPPPKNRPDLFEYSSCHGHYHFQGFASYGLYSSAGVKVLDGQKLAYCMEDTDQIMDGPTIACDKKYDCTNQGIQAGWSDIYGNTLDCQWLDITGVPSGSYFLQVSLNPDRAFEEASFDNNTSSIPVVIP